MDPEAAAPPAIKGSFKRRVGRAFVFVGLLYGLWVGMFFYQIALDDGPFTGEPRQGCASRLASQEVPLFDGLTLLVFDPAPGVEDVPLVALKNRDGSLRWCIATTALKDTKVMQLRFSGTFHPLPFVHPYVRGRVIWTYGSERMTWSITRDGDLEWYRFSW